MRKNVLRHVRGYNLLGWESTSRYNNFLFYERDGLFIRLDVYLPGGDLPTCLHLAPGTFRAWYGWYKPRSLQRDRMVHFSTEGEMHAFVRSLMRNLPRLRALEALS